MSGPAAVMGEQSVPDWLRTLQGPGQVPTPQQMPPAGAAGPGWGDAPGGDAFQRPGTLSVSSLLSEDALPDWIRSAGEPQSPAAAGPAQPPWGAAAPAPAAGPGWGGAPPAAAPGWGQAPAGPPAGQWGQAPAAPPPGTQVPGIATSSLFDDAALPAWLRTAAGGQSADARPAPAADGWGQSRADLGSSWNQPMSPLMPSASAMPGAAQPYQPTPGTSPGGGMSAQSLLDTSSLPRWLGGAPTDHGPAVPAAALGGDGMSAGSLVDERSLPLWLRQEPPSPSVEAPPPGAVSQWLAAPVTDEPLPTWLNQVYASAQVPRVEMPAPVSPPWGAPPSGAAPVMGSVAAGQLVDDTALPDWLRAQAGPPAPARPAEATGGGFQAPGAAAAPSPWSRPGGLAGAGGVEASAGRGYGGWSGERGAPQPFQQPASASPGSFVSPAAPVPGSDPGPSRFSASDLIDPEGLPPWVHQEHETTQTVFSSSSGWTSKQPAYPPGGAAPSSAGNSFWSASGSGAGGYGEAGPLGERSDGAGPAWDGHGPAGEANLPPWLVAGGSPMAGASPSPLDAGAPVSGGARRPAQAVIPDAELPPWLRQRSPAGQPADRSYGAAAQEMGRGRVHARPIGEPAAAPGMPPADYDAQWGEPPAFQDREPAEHYADRFADELPGAARPFGYEYDHGGSPGRSGSRTPYPAGGAAWDEPPPEKRRKRWFGRK
jgi:hypothetical protein